VSWVGAHAGSEDRVLDGTGFGFRDKLRKTANANRDFMIMKTGTLMFTVAAVAVMVVVVAAFSVVI
jgi:hypothetical protein